MHKYKGKYYFSYASDFSQGASKIEYMMSDKPTTGFTYTGVLLPQPPDNYSNNNHHVTIEFMGNWYTIYHNRNVAKQRGVEPAYQRNVAIDQMFYNSDGTIKQVVPTSDSLKQLKYVNPYVKNTAVNMSKESGTETEVCSEGDRNVSFIQNGDWIQIKGVDFGTSNATSFDARVASNTAGGNIEIRLDSSTGKLVGTCNIEGTGGWQTWATKSCSVSGATGVHDLFLKFTGASDYLFNFSSWKFNSDIIPTSTPAPTTKPRILGDLNDDGNVNSIDFALLKLHLLGTTPLTGDNLLNADVNMDGNANAIDFALIRQYLLGMISSFN